MSGDQENPTGFRATLRGWFGGTESGESEEPESGESEEGVVIPFDSPVQEEKAPTLFEVDPLWPVVTGGWVSGQNASGTDPEELRSEVMGAISQMRATVQTGGDRTFLSALYAQLGERSLGLPDFPETPLRLDQLVKEEEPNSQQVMRCIEGDPKLVGRVWGRARSARFPVAPSSLDMAVSRIGIVEVWRLSLETALDNLEIRPGRYKVMADLVRQHGALVGDVTAGLAGQSRGPGFMAGLLHDVGMLLVLQSASQHDAELSTVQSTIDQHHAAISVLIVDAWHLDRSIIPAVAFHHNPNATNAGARDLARLLALADIAVDGELDRRDQRNSNFISAIAEFTRSRVLASKALNLAAAAIDRQDKNAE
jgi:HD-like signal output (HDOD) protein